MKLRSCTGRGTRTSRAPQKKPTDYIPVYDEYKSLFSGCNKFNQQLYGKTFPYQAPNDTNLAEQKNIWNYLFTSVLINVWKSVLTVRKDNEMPDA